MKRFLVVAVGAGAYLFGASFALACLPFSEVPAFFRAWFSKGWQASLFWLKVRHLVIHCSIGIPAALVLVKQVKQTALADGLVIGVLAVGWTVFLRWSVLGGFDRVSWLEISDYLVILLAIPVWVPAFRTSGKGGRA
jgi:hypothetical protein